MVVLVELCLIILNCPCELATVLFNNMFVGRSAHDFTPRRKLIVRIDIWMLCVIGIMTRTPASSFFLFLIFFFVLVLLFKHSLVLSQ